MTTLSKSRALPLLAALAAVIGAVVGIKPFLKFLRRWTELRKRRQARLAMAAKRGGKERKIINLALYSLPDLREDIEPRKKLDSICQQMNMAFPCIRAGFSIAGSRENKKEALLSFLGKPDMSFYMTHCLHYVADDVTSMKLLMHSNLHKQDWMGTGGPFYRGCIEMSTDLVINLEAQGKQDPLLQIVFLRFQPHVTDDSEVFRTFEESIAAFSTCRGISAGLTPYGHGKLIKEDFVKEIQWNDSSMGMTHVLLVAADSPEDLKALQASAVYQKWLATEMPHLDQGQFPPAAVIFYTPLLVDAKC